MQKDPQATRTPVDDDVQVDPDTGLPLPVAPLGEKTEGEIEDKSLDEPADDDALRIDPESRIPRPVPPDLA